MRWLTRHLALLLAALALAGCASTFPEELTRTVNRKLTVTELRRDPRAFIGQRVILGGEILTTVPKPGQTEIELLTRPLLLDDSPQRSDRTEGRVLIRTSEFLDPAVYGTGRSLTVIGTVTGEEERRIGDLPYRYPVIAAERMRLWPALAAIPRDPWWPYGNWPACNYPYTWPYRPGPPLPWWPYWW